MRRGHQLGGRPGGERHRRPLLPDRLTELQGAGLVVRSVDPGPPGAVTYGLSPSGCALIPALHQIGAWAADNLVG